MDELTLCQDDQIITRERMTILTYEHNEDILQLWVDAHRLKKIKGNWTKDGRCIVTGKPEHKCIFIHAHHNSPVYRHPRINKTYQLISQRYWWPNMHQEVMEYVCRCAECQRNKINM